MNRRKSLKIIGGSAVGIAGLILVDSKWKILDNLTHKGFFTLKEEQMISAISDTIIPEGLPSVLPNPEVKAIGAISTGTDKYMIKVFEHCYPEEDQQKIKDQLNALLKKGFVKAEKAKREEMLLALSDSENEIEKEFFDTMKSETITGFSTVKEVMVDYRNYKVAPGYYHGCVDINSKA